jgi:tetratricopeptide (TPR) repeat protein
MNGWLRRGRLGLVALLCLLLAPPVAWAADEPEEKLDLEAIQKERKKRQASNAVNRRISRYLAAAAEANDEGDSAKALELLENLNPKRLNPQERALVYRLMAFVSYGAGDFEATVTNFRKVIDEQILSIGPETKIRFNIAQLYAANQDWQGTIDALNDWFPWSPEPNALAHYLMGISYFQLDDVDNALAHAEKAVDLSEEPSEGFLQLLAALYIQNEDYPSAAPVFEELVMHYPKKQYWVQLSLIYGARDNFRESLAVQQVAYMQGYLTEDKELRRLARSYLFHEVPYAGAQVLEKGLDAGVIKGDKDVFEMLANSWIASREFDRSLPVLAKAAEFSEDGNLYVRLGQVHLQREEWSKATEWFEKALEKGSLKKPGSAQLLLGIAYYNSERVPQARASFQRAVKHEDTRKEAQNWLTHLQNESAPSEAELGG